MCYQSPLSHLQQTLVINVIYFPIMRELGFIILLDVVL